MADPVGAEIVVEQDAPFSTPPTRWRRVVKPKTKFQDTARQLDDTAQETIRSTRYATRPASIEGEPDQAGGARKGRSSDAKSILLQIVELLDKSSAETAELKDVIATQSNSH